MIRILLSFLFLVSSLFLFAQSRDSIYSFPTEYASFIGGDSARVAFMKQRIVYDGLKAESIVKTAYVKLTIEKSGEISSYLLLKGINPKIDKMVLDVVKTIPPWKPAKFETDFVKSYIVLQVKIQFSDKPAIGTTFYDSNWNVTSSKNSSFSRSIIKKDSIYLVEYFDDNFLRIESGRFLSLNPPIKHGSFVSYFTNGQMMAGCVYQNDTLEGEYEEYYMKGSIRERGVYHRNLKHGFCGEFLENGDVIATREYVNGVVVKEKLAYKVIDDKNNFFTKIEADTALVLPHFPNGKSAMSAFIDKNLKFPDAAKNQGIAGEAVIAFDIEVDGSITNIRVVKSLHPLLDEEAIRVVKLMPKWVPATKRGKPIKVKYTWYAGFKEQIH